MPDSCNFGFVIVISLGSAVSRSAVPQICLTQGINACDLFLRTDPHNTIATGTICDLIRIILTMNNFTFNDTFIPSPSILVKFECTTGGPDSEGKKLYGFVWESR